MPVAFGFGPHLIVFVAAAAATVTGYGFVVLSAPLLVLAMPPPEVVPLTLGLGLLLITALLVKPGVWKCVDVGQALRLSAAGVLGIPMGVALLDVLAQDTLRVILGAVVAASALAPLIAGRAAGVLRPGSIDSLGRGPTRRHAGIFAAGFIAGVLSGCVGLNGPPVALYLTWRGAEKERLRATSAATVWLLSAATLVFLTASARLPDGFAAGALTFAPALAVGWLAGSVAFQAIPVLWFSQLSLAFAAAAGIVTAVVGLHR